MSFFWLKQAQHYLSWLSPIYDKVLKIKSWMYSCQILKPYQLTVPVISVGNLTTGGTGKTPFADYLMKQIQIRYDSEQAKNLAIVVRSYKADLKHPALVVPKESGAAKKYGDEAVLLAALNPNIKVYSGPEKWKTAAYAVQQGAQSILLDDGFQHWQLKRDIDIVLLDATEEASAYELIPKGRARESFEALARAHLIVLNKVNLATVAEQEHLKQRMDHFFDLEKVIEMGYSIKNLQELHSQRWLAVDAIKGRKILALSALAKPEIFEKNLAIYFNLQTPALRYPDHYFYSPQDIDDIIMAFHRSGAEYLVTTAKDAVKLRALLKPQQMEVWVAQLELEIFKNKNVLFEKLDGIFN